MMNGALLQSAGLAVGYDDKLVLSGVTLTLYPGEIMALLGPNGGGKSTLLRTLAGLIPKICGGVLLMGEDLDRLSPKEIAKRIAFVPQEEAWQFEFTVEEVVAMGRLPVSNGFFDTSEDRRVAGKAMKLAGCDEFRSRPVTELSGGERQRVLIARALAQEAPIIFLDEPTSHLDPQFQVTTAVLLRTLAEQGKSILLATHDLPTAASSADRGMLVYDGEATEALEMKQLLESEELDIAYETEFERLVTPEGRLVVVPRARS